MWYTYFLELSNHNIYVGFTYNLKRLKKHNDGEVLSTKKFLPVKLKSFIAVDNQKNCNKTRALF